MTAEPATTDFASLIAADRASTKRTLADLTADLAGMIEASQSTNADDEHDPEGATIAFERAQVVAMIADARQRLTDLDAAVVRIANGRYQTCDRCGATIATARLIARPASNTCVVCAAKHR